MVSWSTSWGAVLLCGALAACAKGERDGGGGGAADAGRLPDAGPRIDGGPDIDSGGGGGGPVTLTQSTSMTVTAENNTVWCANGLNFTTEASYFRVFDLAAEGIAGAFTINKVSVGIDGAVGADGTQGASVKLHTLTGDLATGTLSPLTSVDITVTDDQAVSVIDVPVTATAPAGSKLVVEFFIPDGTGPENTLYVGTNNAGQSGPTYVRDECGADQPTDISTIDADFADEHWVLSVDGES